MSRLPAHKSERDALRAIVAGIVEVSRDEQAGCDRLWGSEALDWSHRRVGLHEAEGDDFSEMWMQPKPQSQWKDLLAEAYSSGWFRATAPQPAVRRAEFDSMRVHIEELQEQIATLSHNYIIWCSALAAIGHRGIEKTPGVCGGRARIVRTRVPVWTLELLKRQGATEAELLSSYPTLTAADLVAAWSYAADHVSEIEDDIRQNEMVEEDG